MSGPDPAGVGGRSRHPPRRDRPLSGPPPPARPNRLPAQSTRLPPCTAPPGPAGTPAPCLDRAPVEGAADPVIPRRRTLSPAGALLAARSYRSD
ncbi:hypothetical protein GCM10027570_30130 [Streptomonospora sediminis]